MKRILLATMGVGLIAVIAATLGLAKTTSTSGSVRGRGNVAAAARQREVA